MEFSSNSRNVLGVFLKSYLTSPIAYLSRQKTQRVVIYYATKSGADSPNLFGRKECKETQTWQAAVELTPSLGQVVRKNTAFWG